MEMMPLAVSVWLVAAFSACGQAVSGFGFALLAVPLMIPLVGPESAVVIATALSLFLTVGSSFGQRAHVAWRPVLRVSIGALFGIPLGLVVLHMLDARWLTLLIGIVVIGAVVLLALQKEWRISNSRAVLSGGVISGVLLSSTGMNGPPLVTVFQSMGFAPLPFRASLQVTFMIQDFLAILGFVFIGLADFETLILVGAAVPWLAAGWWLGDRLFVRLGRQAFRWVVLIMLLLSGLIAIVQAAVQLIGT